MLSRSEKLKNTARMAIGWGVPDHWSTGMSQGELTKVIRDLLEYVEFLEKKYNHKSESPFDL